MNYHLVIGASGQVGGHLIRSASDAGFETVGTYHSYPVPGMKQLDIRDQQETQAVITEVRPDVVYLPAALSSVDYCEMHPDEVYLTNVVGVQNVLKTVNKTGAKLVYFSSDYVFDGESGPYCEKDPVNPICEYGRQKLIAEHYIALHAYDYLIVRTTVVYGWERQGKNFVQRLIHTLQSGESIRAPSDQVGSPTYAPNLAEAVVELVCSDAQGLYHVVGPERVNRYVFACEAARVFGLNSSLIQEVSTGELGQVASRPLDAGLEVEKTDSELTLPLVGYRKGLQLMADERKTSEGGDV